MTDNLATTGSSDCAPPAVAERLPRLDWVGLAENLDNTGYARIPGLLPAPECRALAALYDDADYFRKRVIMERHNYGRGQYQYFNDPLPDTVHRLRQGIYPYLAPIANRWHQRMGFAARFPTGHDDFLRQCHAAGQLLQTCLLIQYGAGDYNCLHQDLYGEQVFPFQLVALLSEPGTDFTGGELVLTEQQPRRQSRAEVIPLARGDAAIIASRHRPVRGSRGYFRANLRHGVSTVRSGRRHTLGIIFHNGK